MQGFEEIIGNERIKEHMQSAVRFHKVSHGYILSGEDGLGKNMLVRAFARLLLCEGDRSAQCTCQSCKQIETGNHPDLIYVHHEKPNSIGVDDIRTGINEDIQIKPYRSPYKIYVVDEAEKMTVQAQNALLKTIEEPPSYGIIFLLTTNGAAFLPTILSRCVLLNLKLLSDEEIREELKRRGAADERIETIVKFSRGNLGKALKFVSSENFAETVNDILYLLRNVKTMEFDGLLEAIRKLQADAFDIKECLDFIQMWYRDVLLFKAASDINLLVFHEEYKAIRELAQRSDFNGIEKIIQAIDTARRRLDANVNYELTMELLLLTIKEN